MKNKKLLPWVIEDNKILFPILHVFVVCVAWSLITDRPESTAWTIVGWTFIIGVLAGFWIANYSYWKKNQ